MAHPFAAAWAAVAEAAAIGGGTALLDLGCGEGGFCRFAAGLGATVHGLEAEPEAIERALAAVPGGDFRLGLMEHVPWPADSFDVVTAFNSVQYALDPELALIEACRVARPSGTLAVCKWGPPAGNQFFSFLTDVGVPGLFGDALPSIDPVADAIRTVGLEVLETGDVPAPIVMADPLALQTALARAGIEADPRGAGGRELLAAAARYRLDDGSYRFDNRLRFWLLRQR